MATYKWGLQYRDAEGYTGATSGYVTGANIAAGVASAELVAATVGALTNGSEVGRFGVIGEVDNPDSYGAAADYLSVTFRAEFRFLTTFGQQYVIGVPSPKRSIFMPDGQTIDEANGDVAAFITAVLANHGASKGGVALVGSLRGKLVKGNFRRKETIWTFAADLTTPDE